MAFGGNNPIMAFVRWLLGPKRFDIDAALWALKEARRRHPNCWGAALSSAAGRILQERFADAHAGDVAGLVAQAVAREKE